MPLMPCAVEIDDPLLMMNTNRKMPNSWLRQSGVIKAAMAFGVPLWYALAVTVAFAIVLSPFYFLFGYLHYNPFLSETDLCTNLVFALIVVSATGSPVGALMLLLLLYLIGGLKFYFLRRNITVGDLQDVSEVLQVSTPANILLGCLVICACLWLVVVANRRGIRSSPSVGWFLLPVFFLGSAWVFPAQVFDLIQGRNIEDFNRGADFLWGGQLYAVTYDFAEKKSRQELLSTHSNPTFKQRTNFDNIKTKKNIHIILLESYTSPQRLGLRGHSQTHLPPYKALGRLTYAFAPVFGGNSAASEYEILCGNIEGYYFGGLTFNAFGSNRGSPCLPKLLMRNGYASVASIGTAIHFFNANKAYVAMGFDKVYTYDSYPKQDLDGIRISDREMFEQNRKNLVAEMRETRKPILNYLVTIAGHSPYYLNPERRPLLIRHPDSEVQQYLNRVFYTTQELNEHLAALMQIDPSSIVFIVGDHLVMPALSYMGSANVVNKRVTRRMQDYLLLNNFAQIDAGTIAYNEVLSVLQMLLDESVGHSISGDQPIGTNLGYFSRDSLVPVVCDDQSGNLAPCQEIIADRKYHDDLAFQIIKTSRDPG